MCTLEQANLLDESLLLLLAKCYSELSKQRTLDTVPHSPLLASSCNVVQQHGSRYLGDTAAVSSALVEHLENKSTTGTTSHTDSRGQVRFSRVVQLRSNTVVRNNLRELRLREFSLVPLGKATRLQTHGCAYVECGNESRFLCQMNAGR